REAYGKRLTIVVAQHQAGNVVLHLDQQLVPLRAAHHPGAQQRRQGDLDVHLVVRGVHACGVVDGGGVDAATSPGVLDAGELREAQVAALADDLRPQVVRVYAHRVVGGIADLGVPLGRGLDVRADAAVPQEVDRSAQDGLYQLMAGQGVCLYAEELLHLLRDRHALGAPLEDATTGAD